MNFCDDVHVASFKKFHKSFIKNRLTQKSSDLRFVLFKAQASRPYSRMGRHLVLTNSKTTSSDAVLPIFPKKSIYSTVK